jgi:uncharacterized repeat protein (TIGR02543 family)
VSATANFALTSFTISFDSTGTPVAGITQPYGSAVTTPTAPTKSGYIFAGWYTAAGTAYTFTTMPASNITLHAAWTKIYTIIFDSQGGSSVAPITQPYGSAVTAPTAPTKAGYTFAGWYTGSCFTTLFTFATMPASNTTLYAKWTVSTYTITVTQGSNGTISPGTTTVGYGATPKFTITPKSGYRVVAVTVDGRSVGAVSCYTFGAVTADHTITATFAKGEVHHSIELSGPEDASSSTETSATAPPPTQGSRSTPIPMPEPTVTPAPTATPAPVTAPVGDTRG